MSTTPKASTWDFSEAHKLLDSFTFPKCEDWIPDTQLSSASPSAVEDWIPDTQLSSASPSAVEDRESQSHPKLTTALGNFSKVFETLELELDPSSSSTLRTLTYLPSEPPSYTSDGAAQEHAYGKRVKWYDDLKLPTSLGEYKTIDESGHKHSSKSDAESTENATNDTPTNKRNRKRRPSKGKGQMVYKRLDLPSMSDFESESDIRPRSKHTPAHKASRRQTHFLSVPATESRNQSTRQILPQTSIQTESLDSIENTMEIKHIVVSLQPSPLDAQSSAKPSPLRYSKNDLFQILQQSYQAQLPAHVAQPWSSSLLSWNFSSATPQMMIEPSTPTQDKSHRDFQLRLRLIHSFPQDKHWLMAAVPFANHFHTEAGNGIHVFVDFSNISIGYMQKVSQLRLEAQRRGGFLRMAYQLSFDSLVLLLERGRPVAKRVLAGSTTTDPAIAKAKAIGYDVKIMQRVYKGDGLTERERRAAAMSSTPSPQPDMTPTQTPTRTPTHTVSTVVCNGLTTHSIRLSRTPSNSSGHVPVTPPPSSHTTTPDRIATKGSGKWVEQGVDEILHNKIYESIIDAESPSTIVLATGDGAEGEFSVGFVATVERALNRGWKVELVSWKKNVSWAWRKDSWIEKWGDRFWILELDGWESFLEEVEA